MSGSSRTQNLDEFRNAQEFSILVATDVAEEGLDIADCNWVIRFSKFDTTKSHIQGSGRSRTEGSTIFYFENNHVEEIQKEQEILKISRNEIEIKPLNLEEYSKKFKHIKDTYEYPFDTKKNVRLDFSNCTQKINEFIQKCINVNAKEQFM